MTKTYCDLCGNEIPKNGYTRELRGKRLQFLFDVTAYLAHTNCWERCNESSFPRIVVCDACTAVELAEMAARLERGIPKTTLEIAKMAMKEGKPQ